MAWLGFAVLAAALLVGALLAVTTKALVHSVLWLGLMLAVTSVLFITLFAPLLGGLQLLLYVGGIMVLMLFGVMLTSAAEHESGQLRPWAPARAGATSFLLFAVLAVAILNTQTPTHESAAVVSTAAIGKLLLTTHLLAFEALSLLLLATMIGAIMLSRRSDPGSSSRTPGTSQEET